MTRICCLYTGDDGHSHFSDQPLALGADAAGRLSTGLQRAAGWMYAEATQERHLDWHTAGPGGVTVMLGGWMEIEIGSGERRRFEAGDVLVALDTTGQGHRSSMGAQTRALSLMFDQPAEAVMRALYGRDLTG